MISARASTEAPVTSTRDSPVRREKKGALVTRALSWWISLSWRSNAAVILRCEVPLDRARRQLRRVDHYPHVAPLVAASEVGDLVLDRELRAEIALDRLVLRHQILLRGGGDETSGLGGEEAQPVEIARLVFRPLVDDEVQRDGRLAREL